MEPSQKFTLNEIDLWKIGQTVLYAMGSAAVAALIIVVGDINFPPEYAFVPGIINILLYAAKKFLEGK